MLELNWAVWQEEPPVCETPEVKLIGPDGNVVQRELGGSSINLNAVRQLDLVHFFSLIVFHFG